MGGVFAKALGRLVGKQEMRILMVRNPPPTAAAAAAAAAFPHTSKYPRCVVECGREYCREDGRRMETGGGGAFGHGD